MIIRNIEEKNSRYYVQMPYDPIFVEKLKANIPYPLRQWDNDSKQWHFDKKGLEMFKNLPGVILYEDAVNEVVSTSQYNLPEPCKVDNSINYEKFRRPATKYEMELYPYNFQKEGISRIVNMKAQGLYFECGLGKTYTSICAAKELMDRGLVNQCLVISIVSIAIDSWVSTLDRMGYSYEVIKGPIKFRASLFNKSKADFILALDTSCDSTKYPLYLSDDDIKNANKKSSKIPKTTKSFVDIALKKENLMMIVDELHKLSNTQSKVFKNILKIRKHCVRGVGLTGTVIKSTPERCLLPLRFEYPEIFRNKSEFENTFTIKDMGRFGPEIIGYRNLDVLKSILHRAGMPALKKNHLKDLPDLLQPELVYCETDEVSLDLVDKIRNEDIIRLGKGDNYAELKDVYIRTHEALVCPSTFDPKLKATNRLQAVYDCLESLDGKTVIFTTLKKAIIELYNFLSHKGIVCTCCSGDQTDDEINRRVAKFVDDENCTVLITTIQKMGTGFDRIKIARNAIIYDFNTNASDLIQSIGRLHRNGQKNAVSQFYILQDNAISEYQYQKVMKQKKLIEQIENTTEMTTEPTMDLRDILSLIKDSKNFLRR